MRKVISLLLICCALATVSIAQETKGKYSIDLNFDPAALFDASAGAMFYIPQIDGRYFIASDVAIRLGLDIGFNSSTNYNYTDPDDYDKSTSLYFEFAPGIEKHVGGEKLSIFFGGQLPISTYSSKTEQVIGDNTTEIKNAEGGYLCIGLDGLIGADYYILPNLYVGVLFGSGFEFCKHKDREVDGTVTLTGGKEVSFRISSSSGIRVGFRF